MTTGTNKPEPVGLTAAQKKRYFRLWIIAGLSLSVIFVFKSLFFFGLILIVLVAVLMLADAPLLERYLFGGFYLAYGSFYFAMLSATSVCFFLWTFWDRYSPVFPKRSLWLWFYLCALSPWQIHVNFYLQFPRLLFGRRHYINDYPLTYAGGVLDSTVLIGLGLWMAWRRLRFSAGEKIWFHWLLILVFFWDLNYYFWLLNYL